MARPADSLAAFEELPIGALDMVVAQLNRAVEALSYQDVELAAIVVRDDDRIDARYRGVLSALAFPPLDSGDLRLAAALLHCVRSIERMGDQCVNIAKLVALSGHEAPKDKEILDSIERMGRLAHSQAMFMVLVARCLERIGDQTVDMAEQVVFAVTGLFEEMADASHPRPGGAAR